VVVSRSLSQRIVGTPLAAIERSDFAEHFAGPQHAQNLFTAIDADDYDTHLPFQDPKQGRPLIRTDKNRLTGRCLPLFHA
jgi:hypothetical protein